ncbi:MAG: phosphatase PAP2 family protein, partial [Oscillospiraceae bacterium]
MLEAIQSFDFSVLNAIQSGLRCDWLDTVMVFFTNLGYGVIWIVAAICMLFTKKYRRCGIAILVAIVGGLLIGNVILKLIFGRPRPCWLMPIDNMLVKIPADSSFPSCHTLNSFVSAIVILRHSKPLGIPSLVIASLVSFSRLYVYVHFPTDVLGGIL